MNRIRKFLKANWILVWIAVVVLAFTSISFAEYLANKNRVRRVAANVADEGQQFSSNYMSVSEVELRKVSFNTGDENHFCVIPVSIWNHSETNPQKAYQGDISYTWTMQLVDKDGHMITNTHEAVSEYLVGYSTDGITFNQFNSTYDSTNGYYADGSATFTKEASEDVYSVQEHTLYIRFPESVLTTDPGIYVKVTATPTDSRNFTGISAILGAQKAGDIIQRGWSGNFSDDEQYSDYDAFNYVISGSGEADITLSWCVDYLEMNQISKDEYGWNSSITTFYRDSSGNVVDSLPVGGTTWKKLEFTADSNEVDGSGKIIGLSRYDIQFYMTGDPETDYGSGTGFWTTVKKYVSFSQR